MRRVSRPPSRHTVRPTPRLAVLAVAGALALGLTACSGSDSGASSSAGGGASSEVGSADAAGPGTPAPAVGKESATSAAGGAESSETVAASLSERKLARRADVSLRVDDVDRAAARLRQIATGQGGLVVDEQVSTGKGDPTPVPMPEDADSGTTEPSTPEPGTAGGWGTVTISVPTDRLDRALDAVGEVGTVLDRSTSTDDVTGKYVDTASRVKSMRASVERVRALMLKAEKLSDVVALEGELSRRQADLESLERQLKSLDDQVALAPITVQLTTAAAPPAEAEDPTGFLAGLASGWHAFTTSVRLVLTLIGALLPFALTAALVLGPLAWWWRRRRPTAAPAAPTTPAAT